MNYYHICTEGSKENVLFREEDDYISAMNYIAITCIEHKMNLLAFCVMSNHFHFIVRSEFFAAKKFMISIKRRCSMKHWFKYGENKLLDRAQHPICIKEITDMDYLKSAIAYVLRNPFSATGELMWTYPWSSIGTYFNEMKSGSDSKPLINNSKRQNARILHSKFTIKDSLICTCAGGYIDPKKYVAYQQVESIFVTPKSLFYFLNKDKDKDKEMEIGLTSLNKKFVISDNKILNVLPSIIYNNFGVSELDVLDMKQRLSLIGKLKQMFNSSDKQIGRILQINPDMLKIR